MSGEKAWVLGFQPGADADFCLEQFRDGAPGFGRFHCGVELALVRPGDLRDKIQVTLRDGEAVRQFLQRNRCRCFEPARSDARVAQLCGKCHGKTAGVRGREELLGIGADAVFKPRAERVLRLFQNATICRYRAFPIFQATLPNCRRFPLHAFSPFASFVFLNPENSILERLGRVYSENDLVEKALWLRLRMNAMLQDEWVYTSGQKIAQEKGYAILPPEVLEKVAQKARQFGN